MPIDLANLSRVFRGIAGDFDWLPQHCRIPPEKQRQHYERQRKPNRQPDQRAAEGFFGAASIAQRAQQERKKQAYQACRPATPRALGAKRSKGRVPGMHHIEILITEQDPSVIFIIQTIAARDVQRDLKFLQRPIESIPLGTQGHVQLLPQRAGCQGI